MGTDDWGKGVRPRLNPLKTPPIALYPDPHGTIFSGSAVIDKNNTAGFGKNAMIAIFTYYNDSLKVAGYQNNQTQGIAFSLDEGKTWEKYNGNPVIDNSCEKDFRDPKVFWNDEINAWNMVLAAGDRIKIFSSPNLIDWKFKSDFEPVDDLPGLGVWECPDLFKMKVDDEEKWLMIVSHGDKAPNGGSGTRYFVGNFNGEVFKHEQPSLWLDYGTDSYAGVTYANAPDGKRILIAWMSNWMYATVTPTKVWRSAMTLPRELSLQKDGNKYFLRQKIAGEFASIKQEVKKIDQVELPLIEDKIDLSQAGIHFDCNGEDLSITISNELDETLQIDMKNNQLFVDRTRSGKMDFSDKFAPRIQTMPLGEKVYNFQIYLDRSSCEILLNDGKYAMTNLFFPNEKYSNLQISGSANAELKNFKIGKISRIW
ncbi:MAG: glycoside hydrolase family 32 protein [Calditrichaeota bacterium]|nr:MAG: glycoside hydrolase family 32 protein [Calditrichota bacterium]